MLAMAFAIADEGDARAFQRALDVGEVEIDDGGEKDQLNDGFDRLGQDFIGFGEGFGNREIARSHQEFVVGDDDDRIDGVFQFGQPGDAILDAGFALEGEGAGDDGDGKRAFLTGDLGDDRARAGAGSTAHAGGDEDHVRALDD